MAQDGQTFHLLDHQTVVGCQVGYQVTDKSLLYLWENPTLRLWGQPTDGNSGDDT